jgi:hypothetical protein
MVIANRFADHTPNMRDEYTSKKATIQFIHSHSPVNLHFISKGMRHDIYWHPTVEMQDLVEVKGAAHKIVNNVRIAIQLFVDHQSQDSHLSGTAVVELNSSLTLLL